MYWNVIFISTRIDVKTERVSYIHIYFDIYCMENKENYLMEIRKVHSHSKCTVYFA